jgi:hypothetical protein
MRPKSAISQVSTGVKNSFTVKKKQQLDEQQPKQSVSPQKVSTLKQSAMASMS